MPAIKVIEKNTHIAAPVQAVWAALTDAATIGRWMQDDTIKVSLRVGGKYAFFAGETTGKFTHVISTRVLEYTWRQASWQKTWPDSVVRWELTSSGSGTDVHLTHSAFPNKAERDSHDEGWDIYFLQPMKDWLERRDE